MTTRGARMIICAKVISETSNILARTPHGSSRSIYYPTLLPPLAQPPTPKLTQTNVQVIDNDTYTAAQSMLLEDSAARQGKVAVLNLASEKHPGGGWKGGSLAQEECLCYRSTLFVTLDRKGYYPLPELGGIYSPAVVVFRKEMKGGFNYLPWNEHFVVGVVTIAGLRNPKLDEQDNFDPEDSILLTNKIRQTLRILAVNGQKYIVLGALGCGAFNNPPKLVAQTFRDVLSEPEFRGWFEEIRFAVLAGGLPSTGGNTTSSVQANAIAAAEQEHEIDDRDKNKQSSATRSGHVPRSTSQTTITRFFSVQDTNRQREERGDNGGREGSNAKNPSNSSKTAGDDHGKSESQQRLEKRKQTGQRNFSVFSETLHGLMVP